MSFHYQQRGRAWIFGMLIQNYLVLNWMKDKDFTAIAQVMSLYTQNLFFPDIVASNLLNTNLENQ